MATITSAGIGSGLDVAGLVEKLVSAEGQPTIQRLDRKEATLQLQISSVGVFKSALNDFQNSLQPLTNPAIFNSKTASSSSQELISVSADNSAEAASYEIEVQQLASSAKLASVAIKDSKQPLGTGAITIDLGEYDAVSGGFSSNVRKPPVTIRIDGSNNSLDSIMRAINESGQAVRASIVNDGTGSRLVVSASETGRDNDIRIRVTDDDGTDADMNGLSMLAYDESQQQAAGKNMSRTSSAQNSIAYIDGIRLENASNTVNNAVTGLSITLNGVSQSRVSVRIENNIEGVRQSISDFVSSYNELIKSVDELTGYNPETGESGPLSGDASIRGLVDQIRRVITSSFNDVNTHFGSLASIGIDSERDGTLRVNEAKLTEAIQQHGEEVVNLFTRNVMASDHGITIINSDVRGISGRYGLDVIQQAVSGSYISQAVALLPLVVNTDNDNFRIEVDGVTSGLITIPSGLYDNGSELAMAISKQVNADSQLIASGKTLDVDFVNGRLVFTSGSTGTGSTVAVKEIDSNSISLGLQQGAGQQGKDAVISINGEEITGKGSRVDFTGFARGMSIDISGSAGSRGEIIFSEGVASRLDSLIQQMLAEKGSVSARQKGLAARVDDIAQQRETLNRRLEKIEERYLKQFTTLDAMLGRMRQTSEYLGNQLAALPGAKNTRDS